MKSTSLNIRIMTMGLLFFATSPSYAFLDKFIGSGGATTEEANNAPKDPDGYKGVKHAIGVRDFGNDAGWSGNWNLGVMLESVLYDSGRFVVLSRDKLNTVLDEQDLAASGRTAKSNLAETHGFFIWTTELGASCDIRFGFRVDFA